MKQKAALCLSFAALAVTGYLCLSPHAENRPVPPAEPAVTSSDQSSPAADVPYETKRLDYLVDLEKAKRLLDDDPFLYPTDQMFREFYMERVRLR